MVRVIVDVSLNNDLRYIKAAGLKDDPKPTQGIATGSEFTEVDTGDKYHFAEGNPPKWWLTKKGAGHVDE